MQPIVTYKPCLLPFLTAFLNSPVGQKYTGLFATYEVLHLFA